ncbi:MAG: hypothetical protein M3068_06475 [Gemmatimonadota bacterium]|nr:hypothetical protein [Gemmatimonadota bacterium]
MKRMGGRRCRVAFVALIPALSLASCQKGGGDMAMGQSVVDLGDAVNSLRQETADMQAEIDSLRAQVAKQDTLMRRLVSAVNSMPVSR